MVSLFLKSDKTKVKQREMKMQLSNCMHCAECQECLECVLNVLFHFLFFLTEHKHCPHIRLL